MDILISNATVVTMNESMDVLLGAYLGITGEKITYLGKTAPKEQPAKIIDGTGMVVLPGLINCHTHLATTALRGYLDDLPRLQALEEALKKEDKLDNRSAKAAAGLAIAESLRFGVTSVSDLYYYPDATAQAAADAGIKANIALSSYRYTDESEDFDFETDEQCREIRRVAEKWNGYDNGRIRIDVGIDSEYTSNYKLWEALAGYASQEKLGFQLHLARYPGEVESCLDRTGLTPAQLLDCHRVFLGSVTAAGCNTLTDEDRKLLGSKKVTAVACPVAAMKNGCSHTNIVSCVQAGMNVSLGTGGIYDAGNLDMFETMRAAALTARDANSPVLPASAVLMMATACGAKAQGRADTCGMLKVGFDADLCLVDFSAPHLIPSHNVLNSLVYSAKGGDVAMTMVRGKILYQNGQFPTIDLNALVEELTNYVIPRVFAQ